MEAALSALDEELKLEEELAVANARTSMLGFMLYVMPGYCASWHHKVLCTLIDRMLAGAVDRAMVSVPPRSGKSCIISEHMPAYLLGRDPDTSIIAVSYGAELANSFSRSCQRVIDSAAYRRVFPDTRLSAPGVVVGETGRSVRQASQFEVVGRAGKYYATGVGGSLTGRGASIIIIDDQIKGAEEAASASQMEKGWDWYASVLRTRLARGGRILMVGTRWTRNDTFQRLIDQAATDAKADQFEVINLPAINEDGPSKYDPRQPGEALWPEFFPLPDLEKIRANSSRAWAALYQGKPVVAETQIVREDWWQQYGPSQLPDRMDRVVLSADLTFSDSRRGDWNVFQVWGRHKGHAWLLDQVRAKLAFVRQCEALERLYDRWPEIREVVIEKAANGAALVDAMRSRIPGIIAVPVGQNSKQARLEAVSHLIEAGQVHIPQTAHVAWARELVDECAVFPYGRHDDAVDALSLGLGRLFPPRQKYAKVCPVSMSRASQWNS